MKVIDEVIVIGDRRMHVTSTKRESQETGSTYAVPTRSLTAAHQMLIRLDKYAPVVFET